MSSLISLSKTYTLSVAPYASWDDTGGVMLTDGILPSDASNYRVGWYPNTTVDVIVNLGTQFELDYVRFNFMVYAAAGTYAPASVVIYGSNNGTDWSSALGTFVKTTDWSEADNKWTGAWSNNLDVAGTYQYVKFAFVGISNQMTIKEVEIYGDAVIVASSIYLKDRRRSRTDFRGVSQLT